MRGLMISRISRWKLMPASRPPQEGRSAAVLDFVDVFYNDPFTNLIIPAKEGHPGGS
jgi:hypothetical protein